MRGTMSWGATTLIMILLWILGILLFPLLVFGLGWIVGFITKLIFGGPLIAGFKGLGIHITTDQIPVITGAIAWVGSIFGTNRIIAKIKKED